MPHPWFSFAANCFCFCGLRQIVTVPSGRFAAAGTCPGVFRRAPTVSTIEGQHGAMVRPTLPGIPVDLPFSGKVLGPLTSNLGTGTH
jgi:hypothetical protein